MNTVAQGRLKRDIPMVIGGAGLIALIATGLAAGNAAGNVGSVQRSYVAPSTNIVGTYVQPRVGSMQMGQTAGEEPTAVTTTTTAPSAAAH